MRYEVKVIVHTDSLDDVNLVTDDLCEMLRDYGLKCDIVSYDSRVGKTVTRTIQGS